MTLKEDNLYLRRIAVTVSPPNGSGKRIEGLRIAFRCEKTSDSSPNTLDLEIYNLSEATRSLFEEEKSTVVLEAGYIGDRTFERVFIGNIAKVTHKRSGPDIVTTVEAEDGGNRYRNATLDRGFPPGVKLKSVFDALADSFGLNVGFVEKIPNDQFANGLSITGPVRKALDDLTKKLGMQWSVQDETLQVTKTGKPTDEAAILLNKETGLVDVPSKTDKGVQFSSLLQPRIRPGRRIKIESQAIKGEFTVTKVTHRGESHFGEHRSDCEAKR